MKYCIEKQEEYREISKKIESLEEEKRPIRWRLANLCPRNRYLSLPKRATEIKSDMVINADNIKPLLAAFGGGGGFNPSAVGSLFERR
eukprot:7242239-Ditylum_brightwellii.AAC.1